MSSPSRPLIPTEEPEPCRSMKPTEQAALDATTRRTLNADTNHTPTPTATATTTTTSHPSDDRSLHPGGTRSLSLIAAQAFALGIVFTGSIIWTTTAAWAQNRIWRLPAFFACLSIFHFLEFWTTAHYNVPNARASSFLLWSNPEYNYAHAIAVAEILVLHFLVPSWQSFAVNTATVIFSMILVILGQTVRSAAMITAGTNFNHVPAKQRKQGHELVMTGIYASLRHPSYYGFFWWAIGTQALIGNKVCLVGYVIVLWRFFKRRIEGEEQYLIHFFGDEYLRYRMVTPTGIPFIK